MVKIVGDTMSGLSSDLVEKYDIPIIPQVIIFGEESFLEGQTIDYATFMNKLRSSPELPSTAAPPPELFTEVFERFAPLNEAIICIVPSAVLSGTFRSATVGLELARDKGLTDLDVRIIDTNLVSGPVASLLELAAFWADQGEDADTIEARVHELSTRGKTYFLVDTLKYLAKGGRIGGASALLGSMLQVKPVLTLVDGKVETFEKVRTHKRALQRLKQIVRDEIARNGQGYLTVLHSEIPDQAQALADYFCETLNLTDVHILNISPAVVTHAGPGVLGVGFFTE